MSKETVVKMSLLAFIKTKTSYRLLMWQLSDVGMYLMELMQLKTEFFLLIPSSLIVSGTLQSLQHILYVLKTPEKMIFQYHGT